MTFARRPRYQRTSNGCGNLDATPRRCSSEANDLRWNKQKYFLLDKISFDTTSKLDTFTAVGGTASKLSSHVSVKRNRVGFLRSNLEFVDLGLDISTLSRGWYHVRVLTSSSSTSLYLNDELISTSQEIQRDAVGTIGSKTK